MSTLRGRSGRSQSVGSYGGQPICEFCSEKSKILKLGERSNSSVTGPNRATCLLFRLASFKH